MSYQHFTTTTGAELWHRIDLAHGRFDELLRRVGSGSAVHGSAWSSAEVAQHVLTVLRRYTRRDLELTDGLVTSGGDLGALNAEELHALDDLALEDVLAQIGSELAEVRGVLPGDDLDRRLPFHGGVTMDVAGWLGNVVGELLVHGLDVARGAGERFRIDRGDALIVLNALVQVAPGFVRAPEPFALGVRTRSAVPWTLLMGPDGTESRPTAAGDRLDSVLLGPAPTLLRSFYSRDSLLRSVAGGLLVVGGRRPWRALGLPSTLPRV